MPGFCFSFYFPHKVKIFGFMTWNFSSKFKNFGLYIFKYYFPSQLSLFFSFWGSNYIRWLDIIPLITSAVLIYFSLFSFYALVSVSHDLSSSWQILSSMSIFYEVHWDYSARINTFEFIFLSWTLNPLYLFFYKSFSTFIIAKVLSSNEWVIYTSASTV